MRAVILDGSNNVANVVVLNSLSDLSGAIASDTASIGDHYNGTGFVRPSPVIDITAYKAQKIQQINAWRLAANLSTFPYAGKQIACDALSRSDIDAVAGAIALTGAFPVGFPNTWKATDNTLVPVLDIATFKAMYAAMAAQGTANFARSQSLKAALAAATTQADIDAIVW